MLGWKSYPESGRPFMVRDCWLVVLELESMLKLKGKAAVLFKLNRCLEEREMERV